MSGRKFMGLTIWIGLCPFAHAHNDFAALPCATLRMTALLQGIGTIGVK